MVNVVNDRILHVKSVKEPISSDVYIFKAKNSTWIYDVGTSDEALREINVVDGPKNIVISHFHADHIGNLKNIVCEDGSLPENVSLYVSKQTMKYTHVGEIIDQEKIVDDGLKFKIFPIPSTHAKGCLGLEVGGEFAFIGDALYPSYKDNQKCYNIQLLKEQIETLEGLRADKIFLSHDKKPITRKEIVIAYLKNVYSKRSSDSNFIFQKLF